MLTHIINGVEVEMTPEEESEMRSFWKANEDAKEQRVNPPSIKEMVEALWAKAVNDDSSKVDEVESKRNQQ